MNKKGNINPQEIFGAIIGIIILSMVLSSLFGQEELEKENSNLNIINSNQKNTINNLESTIDNKNLVIKDLNNQITGWETQYQSLNQSYNNLNILNNKQTREISDLKKQIEELTNENLELQNRDIFNVIFKDENVYFEFWDIEIRKDTIVIINIFFFFSLYVSFLFKLNLFRLRTGLNINLPTETKKKVTRWVNNFNNFLTKLEKELRIIGFFIRVLLFFVMFLSLYWSILKIISFI